MVHNSWVGGTYEEHKILWFWLGVLMVCRTISHGVVLRLVGCNLTCRDGIASRTHVTSVSREIRAITMLEASPELRAEKHSRLQLLQFWISS